MKFTTAAIAASAAALVSATPCASATADSDIKTGDVFRVMTLRSGSDIQYGSLQAANGGLVLNVAQQNASCSEAVNYASFQLTEAGELYLYTDNPPQYFYTDRSGMGQGVLGFTTGAQGAPRNSERTGFTLDENNNLIFKDQSDQEIGFQACPSKALGGYSIWLNSTPNPAGYEGCLGFSARAVKEDKAISCSYTAGQ
ncbi:hypothetical protein C7974DRAFT_389664 [Boeremia exigua]|uniref:uncharacterized protein n=1 Tax=Boeremia exigua TaxID=749465 RepID=UPI001E8DD0A2|nr:uncharacterized protein C7974DRAFT_389664 [Boeremia exigua]KAH6637513.1 hypothetical protein C7974DRAFT_389664 [Boeremia exigua]